MLIASARIFNLIGMSALGWLVPFGFDPVKNEFLKYERIESLKRARELEGASLY